MIKRIAESSILKRTSLKKMKTITVILVILQTMQMLLKTINSIIMSLHSLHKFIFILKAFTSHLNQAYT